MSTVLFLDVENMGGHLVRQAVDSLIEKFSPTKKELVYSTAARLPAPFKDTTGWSVYRCKPGKNAADDVLKRHIQKALENVEVDRIILVTSDHGFSGVCKKIVAAGRKLLLVVRQFGRLSKSVLTHSSSLADIFEIGNMRQPKKWSSVFVKDSKDGLHEVFFQNGMTVGEFVNALKEAGAYRKRLTHWCRNMFLDVRDGRVFVMTERLLEEAA